MVSWKPGFVILGIYLDYCGEHLASTTVVGLFFGFNGIDIRTQVIVSGSD